jgi:hypothetical protein
MVQKKYLKGLSAPAKKKKVANIKKTRALLKKGKVKEAVKLAKKRPMTKKSRPSTYTTQIKSMFPNIRPKTSDFARKTGIPMSVQREIVKRGEGAFLSAGSRPSVGSKEQWGYARLYAFYIKLKKGLKLNHDKDLVDKVKIK